MTDIRIDSFDAVYIFLIIYGFKLLLLLILIAFAFFAVRYFIREGKKITLPKAPTKNE